VPAATNNLQVLGERNLDPNYGPPDTAALAPFTLRAQNGQAGYWAPTGPTHEKLYINSGEADINNPPIVDVATMKIIKKMTTGKHPHGVASPKSQDVRWLRAAGVHVCPSARAARKSSSADGTLTTRTSTPVP
jgi:hypothetical protein